MSLEKIFLPADPREESNRFSHMPAPADLAQLLMRAESIRRYQHPDYPAHFSDDTTAAHTLRLIRVCSELDLPVTSKAVITRMLWVHDLPEVITTDITSVEKENEQIERSQSLREQQAARDLLSESDQALLDDFNAASSALKGRLPLSDASPEALIAKAIDLTENNVGFHYYLTRWVGSDIYAVDQLPPNAALTYTFRQYETVRTILDQPETSETARNIAKDMLGQQIDVIRRLWLRVPTERVPEAISGALQGIED